jgi:ribose 1,5-bisphosphokinase
MDGREEPGAIIVVVGPSGAGKDRVIGFAARQFAGSKDIGFVRRVITRPTDAGGEVHESVSPAGFDTRLAAGEFAVAWQAHGLKYGIPREAVRRTRDGETLIANGSRGALGQFRKAFPRVCVVNITASPQVLASRLVARGRESEADIFNRLRRQVPDLLDEADVMTIDNSGPLDIAGQRFAAFVASLKSRRPA